MTVRITDPARGSGGHRYGMATQARRVGTRLDRLADNLILFGCWMGLVLIGACIGAALLASYLHRAGKW